MSWRVIKQIVLASFHLDTAYRSGFWFMVGGRVMGMVGYIATYEVIFHYVERIAGLSEAQALLYFATLAARGLVWFVRR